MTFIGTVGAVLLSVLSFFALLRGFGCLIAAVNDKDKSPSGYLARSVVGVIGLVLMGASIWAARFLVPGLWSLT